MNPTINSSMPIANDQHGNITVNDSGSIFVYLCGVWCGVVSAP